MKVDERTVKFSLNEKKDILKAMKKITKAKGSTMSDEYRAFARRYIKANQKYLED